MHFGMNTQETKKRDKNKDFSYAKVLFQNIMVDLIRSSFLSSQRYK